MNHHDIFISYRRDGGFELAHLIYNVLHEKKYATFMDVEDLKSGKFNEALYKKIEDATDVIVVLTPGCLDRCQNDDDWLRQEIRYAIQCDRNIVPVLHRKFLMPAHDTLPSDIADLCYYHGLTPSQDFSSASIDKLISYLKSKPIETIPVQHTTLLADLNMIEVEFNARILDFAVLPNSNGVAVCTPEAIYIKKHWEDDTALVIPSEDYEAMCCSITADGTMLIVGNSFVSASLYSLETGALVRKLERTLSDQERARFKELGINDRSSDYLRVAVSPNGKYVALGRYVSSRDENKVIYPHDINPIDEPVDIYEMSGRYLYSVPGFGARPVFSFSLQHTVILGLELDGDDNRDGNDNFFVFDSENGNELLHAHFSGYIRDIVPLNSKKEVMIAVAGSGTGAIQAVSIKTGYSAMSLR